jgi:hypothetical protein
VTWPLPALPPVIVVTVDGAGDAVVGVVEAVALGAVDETAEVPTDVVDEPAGGAAAVAVG